ncbi:SDR family oxidoreductase [Desertibacillus haloalkaliphilus]|nr:SDR family oxidoreductase [Desertibacillus haloalkaliphilus]
MNILITGASGFLGSKLATKLLEQNHNVYLLVRNAKKIEHLMNRDHNNMEGQVVVLEGELTEERLGLNKSVLNQLKGKIDAIYHTAALLSFDDLKKDDVFRVNVEGTRHVLDVAKMIGVQKFIHVSTAYTLGDLVIGEETLYPETNRFNNYYEESKSKAEHLVMSYQEYFDVSVMRPAIIIGDSETGEASTTFGLYGIIRAIELLKKRAMKKGNTEAVFRLIGNKETVSNLVPVDYVVKVLILGLRYGKTNTVYNITNPNPPSNQLIIETILKSLGTNMVKIVPHQDAHLLTEDEINFNKPLQVFNKYLNCSKSFKDENTRTLLNQEQDSALNMNADMLSRIIGGFIERKKVMVQK